MIRLVRSDRRGSGVLAFVAGLSLVAGLTLTACRQGSTTSPQGQQPVTQSAVATGNTTVIVQKYTYSPTVLTIPVGAAVTWLFTDIKHNVTANDGSFTSPDLSGGQSYSYTFAKAGTYPYHCSIHPSMTGTIIVR